MSIKIARGFLCRIAKFLGNRETASKGRITRQVGIRAAGKVTGRGLRKL